MIIGSGAGRLFGTEDQGVIWIVLAEPTDLRQHDDPGPGLRGARPQRPGVGALDNYMLVGTAGGHIFVTFTGGGNGGGSTNAWTNISAGLDGSPVQRIVTDPTRGTHDAYAITTDGRLLQRRHLGGQQRPGSTSRATCSSRRSTPSATPNLDHAAAAQPRRPGRRLAVRHPVDPKDATNGHPPDALRRRASAASSARSTTGPTGPSSPTRRSTTPVANGDLPAATITDLDMVLGNVDPTTGHPERLDRAERPAGDDLRQRLLRHPPGADRLQRRRPTRSPRPRTTLGHAHLQRPERAERLRQRPWRSPSRTSPTRATRSSSAGTTPTTASRRDEPDVQQHGQPDRRQRQVQHPGELPDRPGQQPLLLRRDAHDRALRDRRVGDQGERRHASRSRTTCRPRPRPVFVNATPHADPADQRRGHGGTVITTSTAPNFAVTDPRPRPRQHDRGQPGPGRQPGEHDHRRLDQPDRPARGTLPGSSRTRAPVGTYTYEITYTVTIDGQPTDQPAQPATTVKVVAADDDRPALPADDSGILGDGITNVTQPHFVGTAVPNTATSTRT